MDFFAVYPEMIAVTFKKSKMDFPMTREELLRVLVFADTFRQLGESKTSLATVDARWNVISYAMKRHLEGKLLTITSLADAADVPYGTAMRRIGDLIDEGLLLKRPRSKTGKSFSLHPTRALISQFEEFALEFKRSVGETFGISEARNEQLDGGFYFGGGYMASRILSYPNAMRVGIGHQRTIKILAPVDPTFQTLKKMSPQLAELCGNRFEFTTMPLDLLHEEICADRSRKRSRYDIIAVDMPWIGELADKKAIQPLDPYIDDHKYRSADFHSTIWQAAQYKSAQYGIPIQPTVELLFCRKDLLDEVGLPVPKTTQEVLEAVKALHGARRGQSGIVMNFGRGTPVAHTFMHAMAHFGSPFIDLPETEFGFDTDEIGIADYGATISSDAGYQAAEYLMEVLEYSHPDSMKCDWDRRIEIFSKGEAAITYGWSIRASRFELNTSSAAHGNVVFAPHPARSGLRRVSPVGGFALTLPTSLTEDRAQAAWQAMEYLTRPEMMKLYVQNGNLTSPRFSTSADPEVQAISNMLRDIDQLEQNGTLQVWPRAAIPEFSNIVSILGREIHSMLRGQSTIKQALEAAQTQINHRLDARQ